MDITPDNVCDLLCCSSTENVDMLFTTHLNTIGEGLKLLDPAQNKDDFECLLGCARQLNRYMREHNIKDRDSVKPYIEWLNDILDDRPHWPLFIYRLPNTFVDAAIIDNIYAGSPHINIFKLDDILTHLAIIMRFYGCPPQNTDDIYYHLNVDYRKVHKALEHILMNNQPFSDFDLLRVSYTIDKFNKIGLSILANNPVPGLFFEVTYCHYAILTTELNDRKDSIDYTNFSHLHFPPGLDITSFYKHQIIDYLEYNYVGECLAGFFPKLKLYMAIHDIEDITPSMLQFVYDSIYLEKSNIISNNLPEFI